MPFRPAHRPLARRTIGLAWLAVALGSVVPAGLLVVPPLLVAGIVLTWGRARTLHLWLAAVHCQVVFLARIPFDGEWTRWLASVLVGGFPALAIALSVWLAHERETVKGLVRSA